MEVKSKNLKPENKTALRVANQAWTDCVAKNFLGQWLNGANVTIEDVCQEEHKKMTELDGSVYGAVPFKTENIA